MDLRSDHIASRVSKFQRNVVLMHPINGQCKRKRRCLKNSNMASSISECKYFSNFESP